MAEADGQFVLAVLLAPSLKAAGFEAAVTVTGGQIRGTLLEKGGAVFKGIPFAAPPLGDLRWREPTSVKSWPGVRDATQSGPPCAQDSYFIPNAKAVSREDCLYLDVWAPEWPAKSNMAVMVWIPGGGNFAGAGSAPGTDGESLARHGVVLVSINYRLGAFGFFAHPALTRESAHHASGNQGILDQIAALKWVQANITKFGGDPKKVTIFGESAGSLDVGFLMTSPLSKGLFEYAIGDSGAVISVGQPLTLKQAEARGEALVSHLNVASGASLQQLRSLPAADILAAQPNYLDQIESVFPSLGATVDGYVFPKAPAEVFAAGKEHRVSLILGNNSGEWIPGEKPPEDLRKALTEHFGSMASQALALYSTQSTAPDWATDASFRCTAVAQLAWHARAGNPAFEFQFARVPPGRNTPGAIHASELNYVFGTLKPEALIPPGDVHFNEADHSISEAMQQYWTNFVKTGNPNGRNLPNWPKFENTTRAYIEFTDAGPAAREGLRRPFCDLYVDNLKAAK